MPLHKLSVEELKAWLESAEAEPLIIDVREPWEYQVCHLESSIHIPMRQKNLLKPGDTSSTPSLSGWMDVSISFMLQISPASFCSYSITRQRKNIWF